MTCSALPFNHIKELLIINLYFFTTRRDQINQRSDISITFVLQFN